MKRNTGFNPFVKLTDAADFGSLRVRLWGYFGLFAVVLVITLWILQVVFLNYYYEGMKLRETQRIVADIERQFQQDEPVSNIRSYVTQIYRQSSIYIQIESEHGFTLVTPFAGFNTQTSNTDASGNVIEELPANSAGLFYPTVYRNEIDNLKKQLIEESGNDFSKQTIEPETERKTLEYAVFLEVKPKDQVPDEPGEITKPDMMPDTPESDSQSADRMILYVFSPLYPQESTAQILTEQLLYVTIIAVLLSVLLGFYLSRMISKPLKEITERAEGLAAGNYGIDFHVSNYSEIERLADTLSAASNELADTRNMQRDIIANVSHDLKTPLTMIRSYAEMIGDLSGNDPEKRGEHLKVIIDETDRLSALIAELLDISKLQTGELSVNLAEFSLKELIQSTINTYQDYVAQDGYKLIFISMGDGLVHADETRIKQVLDNLISNALKYGGKDKTVEIRMVEKGDFVRVEVTDHGIGISKRDLRHVWERYYQSSVHHSRSDSTGLGLSIVKEILVLHNAKFGVKSALRHGSTFWFEISTLGPAPETDGQEDAAADGGAVSAKKDYTPVNKGGAKDPSGESRGEGENRGGGNAGNAGNYGEIRKDGESAES